MSSWAVCGTRKTSASEHEKVSPAESKEVHPRLQIGESAATRTGLSKTDQEFLGRQCKRLIDTGRTQFLREHGFNARLQIYTKTEMSLENVVLVATPKVTIEEVKRK